MTDKCRYIRHAFMTMDDITYACNAKKTGQRGTVGRILPPASCQEDRTAPELSVGYTPVLTLREYLR